MELFVQALFSLVCHQLPERSFGCGGAPLPVCARCFGLWASLFPATLVLLWARPQAGRRWQVYHLVGLVQAVVLALLPVPALARAVSGAVAGQSLMYFFWRPALGRLAGAARPQDCQYMVGLGGELGALALVLLAASASSGEAGATAAGAVRSGCLLLLLAGALHLPLVLMAGAWALVRSPSISQDVSRP